MKRYAVVVSGMDDLPVGMQVVAHVSGNSIDVLHCPFCGSGSVIARSDGTIECGYCMTVFTVQVQPAYPGFPQSVNGQPYVWPGMPDPSMVAAPDAPMGQNVNPLAGGDPIAEGEEGDNPFGDEGGDEESDGSIDNPFAKSDDSDSGDDKKSDKKKSDNPFAKKKSYRTVDGAELPADEFINHLAIRYSHNPLLVAQSVRKGRKPKDS